MRRLRAALAIVALAMSVVLSALQPGFHAFAHQVTGTTHVHSSKAQALSPPDDCDFSRAASRLLALQSAGMALEIIAVPTKAAFVSAPLAALTSQVQAIDRYFIPFECGPPSRA